MEKVYLFKINRLSKSSANNSQVIQSSVIPQKSDFTFWAKSLVPAIYHFTHKKSLRLLENRLLAFMNNKQVMVRTGDYATPNVYASQNRNMEEVPFNDWYYQQRHKKGGKYPPYLGNHKIHIEDIAALDIPLPVFCNKKHLAEVSLWVGDKGCVTPLHQDGLDNVVYQLKGSKNGCLFILAIPNNLIQSNPFLTPHQIYLQVQLILKK